jgi:outer membrane protein assembly factor BamB
MAERRTAWLPFLVAAVVAVTGVVVVLVTNRSSAPECARSVAARSPLVAPARFGDDEHLTTLARSVNAMPAPVGPVRAGVGFNYGQWLHLYGVGDGLLAFTKNNAPVTLLDGETLKPRWALRPATKRIAWDASATRLALLDLSAKQKVRVGSYDLTTGRQRWCVELSTRHEDGQPVSTAYLDDGDLLVALPVSDGLDVARLSARTGKVLWWNSLERAARADYLGLLIKDVFVAGGVEEYRLAEVDPDAKEADVVTAYSTEDGRPFWSWTNGRGMVTHVVGVAAERTILMTRSAAGDRLRALDATGAEEWEVAPADGAFESTLRGEVVLMRSRTGLDGYSVATGKRLWHRAIPTDRTYFPYGFTLGQMPSLDASHVLVPTTTSLQVLTVTTGKYTDYPLPTDGVRTTYWPYQLVSTAALIGIVTNTGGVLADRVVGPLR